MGGSEWGAWGCSHIETLHTDNIVNKPNFLFMLVYNILCFFILIKSGHHFISDGVYNMYVYIHYVSYFNDWTLLLEGDLLCSPV